MSARDAQGRLPVWLDKLVKLEAGPDRDRSRHQFRVVCALIEAGWSDNQIRASAEVDTWGTRYRDDDGRDFDRRFKVDIEKARSTTSPKPDDPKFRARTHAAKAGLHCSHASNGQTFALNEDGIALKFAETYGDQLRYCHHTGAWFLWVDTHWKKEETELAF